MPRGSLPPVLAGFVFRRGDFGLIMLGMSRTPGALEIGNALLYFSVLASGAVGRADCADKIHSNNLYLEVI